MKKKKQNKWIPVAVSAAVAALLLGVFFYLSASGNVEPDHPAFHREHPVSQGPATARVTMMEFFDPACEGCRAFYPVVKSVLRDMGDDVRLTLRYATFHRGSDEVVKMLEAARLQGKYWPALEALLARQPEWASRPQPDVIWNYLASVGVDIERAKRDVKDARIANILRQDEADLVALKVVQTPTFFINGKRLTDFSEEGLREMVREELALTAK